LKLPDGDEVGTPRASRQGMTGDRWPGRLHNEQDSNTKLQARLRQRNQHVKRRAARPAPVNDDLPSVTSSSSSSSSIGPRSCHRNQSTRTAAHRRMYCTPT